MNQPLVSRPPYGSPAGGSPVSQSGLPQGDPAGKGVSLDPSIPGASTYAKPSGEAPREPSVEDSSMYRVDNADNLLKDQGRQDEIDHSQAKPTYQRPGGQNSSPKTKYPYRDGVPNRHNAALIERVARRAADEVIVQNVVNLWLLKTAHEVTIPLEGQVKVAVKLSEVESGLNPKVLERAQKCSVGLKRADTGNLRWIFTVDAGNGPKLVRLKATRKGNTTALAKMDVAFSCSCKAWRWLGSEYHAKGEKYLDGKPTGTASTPDIKDPERINRVCKHVAAVINQVRGWTVPVKKKKAAPK